MQQLLDFLKTRLQLELPHHDIQKEGISERLLQLIKIAEATAKKKRVTHPARICAVMMAFYESEGKVYLPMMLRPKNSRTHAAQVAFPGGKKDKEDIDIFQTAIREMHEEVGVVVPRNQILGALTPVYIPPSNSLVTPIVAYLREKPTYIPSPVEVDEVLDVTINDLRNIENMTTKKAVLSSDDYINMPAFKANGKIIWGGTARMIAELNKLLHEYDGQHKPINFFDLA